MSSLEIAPRFCWRATLRLARSRLRPPRIFDRLRYVEHLNSWAERGRYLTPEETANAYKMFWEYLNDQPTRFEERRREFFMINLFTENDQRFALYLEPAA